MMLFSILPHLCRCVYWDHARLVADPDERIGMTAIHFHEGVQVLNGGDV